MSGESQQWLALTTPYGNVLTFTEVNSPDAHHSLIPICRLALHLSRLCAECYRSTRERPWMWGGCGQESVLQEVPLPLNLEGQELVRGSGMGMGYE